MSSLHHPVFELCAESLLACVAAGPGGADRIELCRALDVGGLTPDDELVKAAVQQSGLPVHVLLRPAAETFCYSSAEIKAIEASLVRVKALGAAGVVVGVLREDGRVDTERTRSLVELARPLPVTFHRAFDETPDPFAALEDVVSTGCARVLTSGGAPDVVQGAKVLEQLVQQAGERLDVALGGGLRLSNVEAVAQATGAKHFHASLRTEMGEANGSVGAAAHVIRTFTETLIQVFRKGTELS